MMTVLNILGYILTAIVVVVVLVLIVIGLKFIVWFNYRPCKHCGHNMVYRGLKEDDNNGHYLFHCEHCGAWENVPREEFTLNCDKDCNPNVI